MNCHCRRGDKLPCNVSVNPLVRSVVLCTIVRKIRATKCLLPVLDKWHFSKFIRSRKQCGVFSHDWLWKKRYLSGILIFCNVQRLVLCWLIENQALLTSNSLEIVPFSLSRRHYSCVLKSSCHRCEIQQYFDYILALRTEWDENTSRTQITHCGLKTNIYEDS